MAQTVVEHLAICAAIQDGDETAAVQATALHINNSLHNNVAARTDDLIGHTTFSHPDHCRLTRTGDPRDTRRRKQGTQRPGPFAG